MTLPRPPSTARLPYFAEVELAQGPWPMLLDYALERDLPCNRCGCSASAHRWPETASEQDKWEAAPPCVVHPFFSAHGKRCCRGGYELPPHPTPELFETEDPWKMTS